MYNYHKNPISTIQKIGHLYINKHKNMAQPLKI